ncbi:phage portal protein [Lactobacillus sp. PV034]|uniref:phage portal protein n=1 Tax=Lactobacillus sp. PV034 TaxID=2594495 RepID=UPI00224099EC|nr:phage portal protein [Lactobacillus sp. PV034]QNQ80793.1 phage portal protein [Lactobacillus sp. PV034]
MDVKVLQNLIKNTATLRERRVNRYKTSLRYYENKTDITNRNNGKSRLNKEGKDKPLRHADNRVPQNFHQLLVDQEASYVATKVPQIDVGDEKINNQIIDVLGDQFALTLNNLVVDAALGGYSCLHYWLDDDNNFRYSVVPFDQVTPIFDTTLTSKLIGLLRSYKQLDSDTGKYFIVHEYWTDQEAMFFRTPDTENVETLEPYNRITTFDVSAGYETGASNVFHHKFGRVPFIIFPKNRYREPDLFKYKGLIDAYDDIYNGFLNDIDDIQQVVLVLKNYGGTDLRSFMKDLNEYKAVKFNNSGNGDQSGIDTLQIEIPTEARNTVLNITRDNIFVQGQGIDPTKFDTTNASGTAIKMLYSTLELKASTTEANFRNSISDLVRAIMTYLNLPNAMSTNVIQTWQRTMIEDSLSQAQVLSTVANWSSKEAIAKANPIVDDWQQELKYQEEDAKNGDPFAPDSDYKPDDSEDDVDDEDE